MKMVLGMPAAKTPRIGTPPPAAASTWRTTGALDVSVMYDVKRVCALCDTSVLTGRPAPSERKKVSDEP